MTALRQRTIDLMQYVSENDLPKVYSLVETLTNKSKEVTSTPKNKFLVHSRRMIVHTQGRGGSRCGHRRPTITQCMGNQTSECAS
jgi:hypothetical protein